MTPTATPAESTGPQGLVQTGTVTFTEGDPVAPIDKDTITLLDETGQPAASVEAKSPAGDVIGTFTVDKETGVVTFTPTDKSYSGDVVPVKVQAADTNGTTVETTYTPKITPVVPTSEDATSTDIQGATQSGKPTFTEGNPNVPIDEDTPATFEDGSTTKTVDGEGTCLLYTSIIVPEEEYDINEVVRKVKEGYESGAKTHHVIVVAEGVMGAEEFAAKMKEAGDTSDLRATNIGHVVRGGSPTARDRVLASWMGAHAVDLLKQGIGGVAVGIHNEELVESPILGTAEEGALFSLTEDGKIIVNNPHKARLDFADLNRSLSNLS